MYIETNVLEHIPLEDFFQEQIFQEHFLFIMALSGKNALCRAPTIDSFTPGRRTGSSFFQILYQQSQQNMCLLSFVGIQKICIFTKFGGCSSKIEPATPILILKFKRAWQTQFFSHTLQILVNDRFFIGRQMIFYSIFCVSNRKAEIGYYIRF